jgi:hypothetical protein
MDAFHSTTIPTHLPQTKTTNKDTQRTIEENVEANALNLTLSALSAALGDIKVLKLVITAKNSLKYQIIKDEEEIIRALQWIAKYGHGKILPSDTDDDTYQYFILQQSTTNMAAWNALIDRNLGKVPNESKIDLTATLDLAQLGQRAIENKKRNPVQAIPSMTLPSSWVTPE